MVSWNTPAGLKRSLRALLPWLSCLNGAKTIETESWSTKWPALSTSLASSERHRSLDALSQAWSSIVGLGTGQGPVLAVTFLGANIVSCPAHNRSPIFLAPAGGHPLERRAAGGGVRRWDRRVPRRGSGCRGACSNAYFQCGLPPEGRVRAYYLQRTRFESIAERKLRRHQLTEDGNVEIGGRDLR